MIYRILFPLLTFFWLLSNALAAELSQPTNGVYLVIGGFHHDLVGIMTNKPMRFDDRLVFLTFCDTGKIELSYPLDPAYGVKINMTDANGKEVSKTGLGKRFGSKFDRLHSVTDTRPYPILAWGAYKDNLGLGGARFFESYPVNGRVSDLTPKDLFEMKEPGVYTLEIQMQMFYFNPHSTNAWQRDLFQFSPIKIKVEKPPEK